MQRVTLIRPPSVVSPNAVGEDAVPPIGLAYLAAYADKAGHQVTVVDAVGEALNQWQVIDGWSYEAYSHGLSISDIVNRIPRNTDIIGISCMFSMSWPHVSTLITEIREHFKDAMIVAGGEHVTAIPEYILETCLAVDVCVLGEGEAAFVGLVDAIDSGKATDEIVTELGGLVLRHNKQMVRSQPGKRIREIDEITVPDWSFFPISKYIDGGFTHGVNRGRSMPIMASRGCPYQCTFCSSPSMWTTLWRVRTPESVIDEMRDYIERYNVTNFDFYDLTAIVKRSWIIEFAKLVAKQLPGITWQLPSGTRSEAIDAEVAELLYASGCRNINFAPESGSQVTLQRIKKKVDLNRMLISMRDGYRNGLEVKVYLMVGLPGERKRDVLATIKFITQMAIAGVQDVSCFAYCPYPGSELFRELNSKNRVSLSDEYFMSLAYYTMPGKSVSYSEYMSDGFVRMFSLFAMGYFYAVSLAIRPQRAWRTFKNIVCQTPESRLETVFARFLDRRKLSKLNAQ